MDSLKKVFLMPGEEKTGSGGATADGSDAKPSKEGAVPRMPVLVSSWGSFSCGRAARGCGMCAVEYI